MTAPGGSSFASLFGGRNVAAKSPVEDADTSEPTDVPQASRATSSWKVRTTDWKPLGVAKTASKWGSFLSSDTDTELSGTEISPGSPDTQSQNQHAQFNQLKRAAAVPSEPERKPKTPSGQSKAVSPAIEGLHEEDTPTEEPEKIMFSKQRTKVEAVVDGRVRLLSHFDSTPCAEEHLFFPARSARA